MEPKDGKKASTHFKSRFMSARSAVIYTSDFFQVTDFACLSRDCSRSEPVHSRTFSVNFVGEGNFLFDVFHQTLDSYTGCVLFNKPRYPHTIQHVFPTPNVCTIIDFSADFYEKLLEEKAGSAFLKDPDLHATLLRADAETEWMHFHLRNLITTIRAPHLEIDSLVLEFLSGAMDNLSCYQPSFGIYDPLKKNHLVTIERAKTFMNNHLDEDISLKDIATHCFVSPFHFSRIFKRFTSVSPHHYLQKIRLKYSETLLKDTSLPLSDVAQSSGFNSMEHFTSSFRHAYGRPPLQYRLSKR